MLARPGWNGSGFNADPWWTHAVFYAIGDAPPDFKAIAARLDALQSLGADALILPMPAPPAPGAEDDGFDQLVSQTSRRSIHILLEIPASSGGDLTAAARYWLGRGVSGFRVVTPPQMNPQDAQAIVQAMRKVTSSAVGGRFIISDFSPAEAVAVSEPRRTVRSSRTVRSNDAAVAQLQVDARLSRLQPLDASTIRSFLEQSLVEPNLLLDAHGNAPASLARAMAAIALTTHPAALVDADAALTQPRSAPSAAAAPALLDWYRKLIALHHGNATLRYGSVAMLDFDAQNALVWVIRPPANATAAPPIVVTCNLSSAPVQLSLTAPLKSLNLRGWFLRTLLRTDDAMGAQDLNSVTVPPFGVYIGELRR
jgi:alpha-glucosidase